MSVKRKGNFEYFKNSRINSDKENINTDKENINPATDDETTVLSESSGTGSDTSWGLGRLNLNAIKNPYLYDKIKPDQNIKKETSYQRYLKMIDKNTRNIDDGYETDDTVLDEEYVVPNEDIPKESPYERYLRMTDKSRRNIDAGYETEDTVLDEDYDNYMKNRNGGRRTKRRRLRFSKTRKNFRNKSKAKKSYKRKRVAKKRKGKTRRY